MSQQVRLDFSQLSLERILLQSGYLTREQTHFQFQSCTLSSGSFERFQIQVQQGRLKSDAPILLRSVRRGRSKISEYARSKTGMVTRPFNHPITVLQSLFPGAFPDPLPEQETRREKPTGALLSTDEAADYLGISAETLRRLCRRKAITFIQVTPSEYRFHPGDLEEYINSRRNRRRSGVH